jgi:hypothetical protein
MKVVDTVENTGVESSSQSHVSSSSSSLETSIDIPGRVNKYLLAVYNPEMPGVKPVEVSESSRVNIDVRIDEVGSYEVQFTRLSNGEVMTSLFFDITEKNVNKKLTYTVSGKKFPLAAGEIVEEQITLYLLDSIVMTGGCGIGSDVGVLASDEHKQEYDMLEATFRAMQNTW